VISEKSQVDAVAAGGAAVGELVTDPA
jgi:hypothetical protein